MSTHIQGEGYNKHIHWRRSSLQFTHISLINATISLLLTISHKDVLSRIQQSSLRIPHNTGCGCNNTVIYIFVPVSVLYMNTGMRSLHKSHSGIYSSLNEYSMAEVFFDSD